MRETLTLRLNPDVIEAARRKPQADNRTLHELCRDPHDPGLGERLRRWKSSRHGHREYVAVPLPGETARERHSAMPYFALFLKVGTRPAPRR